MQMEHSFMTMNLRTKKVDAPATGREEAIKSVTSPHQLSAKVRDLLESTKKSKENLPKKNLPRSIIILREKFISLQRTLSQRP